MTVRTQELVLGWASEIRFFEHRAEILRWFKDSGELSAFRWFDQALGLRLGPFFEVIVRPTGLSINASSPDFRSENAEAALAEVIGRLTPSDVSVNVLRAQVLLAIDGDSKSSAAASGQRLANGLGGAVSALDWAMLLDGQSRELKASFQVEYGIVSAAEVPARLGRAVGRMQNRPNLSLEEMFRSFSGASDGDSIGIDLQGVPASALFFDWTWQLDRAIETHAEIIDVWRDALRATEELASGLQFGLGIAVTSTGRMEAEG